MTLIGVKADGADLRHAHPMSEASGMAPGPCVSDIGLRYVLLPIMAAGMGAVAERAAR